MEEEVKTTIERDNNLFLEKILSWIKNQHWLTKVGIILLVADISWVFFGDFSTEADLIIILFIIPALFLFSLFLIAEGLYIKAKKGNK